MKYPAPFDPESFIRSALQEDVGDGDHTSNACIPANAMGAARLLVKQAGVIAGVDLAVRIIKHVDKGMKVKVMIKDGTPVKPGDIVFTVHGSERSILMAERLLLNCMQRMSGIATKTADLVAMIKGTDAKLLDTRKTTPGFRALEKVAVVLGGGYNHRFGLYDMILVKDNHVDFAGGIDKALDGVKKLNAKRKKKLKVEIEARTIAEVQQILKHGYADRILLDNFTPAELKKAVKIIGISMATEASGNINTSNIKDYARCGVNFISVGALTHSYQSLDLSLKAISVS